MAKSQTLPREAAVKSARPFEVRIGDAVYYGDSSDESFAGFFKQLPDDLKRRFLLNGCRDMCWQHALQEMLREDAPSGEGTVRLEYVEVCEDDQDGGWLYFDGACQGPRAHLWSDDVDLVITWEGERLRKRIPLACVEMHQEFFTHVLPAPVQAWWLAHGGTSLSFYAKLHDLQYDCGGYPVAIVTFDFVDAETVLVTAGASYGPQRLVEEAGYLAKPLDDKLVKAVA